MKNWVIVVEKLQLLGLAKQINRLSHIAQMNINERKKEIQQQDATISKVKHLLYISLKVKIA